MMQRSTMCTMCRRFFLFAGLDLVPAGAWMLRGLPETPGEGKTKKRARSGVGAGELDGRDNDFGRARAAATRRTSSSGPAIGIRFNLLQHLQGGRGLGGPLGGLLGVDDSPRSESPLLEKSSATASCDAGTGYVSRPGSSDASRSSESGSMRSRSGSIPDGKLSSLDASPDLLGPRPEASSCSPHPEGYLRGNFGVLSSMSRTGTPLSRLSSSVASSATTFRVLSAADFGGALSANSRPSSRPSSRLESSADDLGGTSEPVVIPSAQPSESPETPESAESGHGDASPSASKEVELKCAVNSGAAVSGFFGAGISAGSTSGTAVSAGYAAGYAHDPNRAEALYSVYPGAEFAQYLERRMNPAMGKLRTFPPYVPDFAARPTVKVVRGLRPIPEVDAELAAAAAASPVPGGAKHFLGASCGYFPAFAYPGQCYPYPGVWGDQGTLCPGGWQLGSASFHGSGNGDLAPWGQGLCHAAWSRDDCGHGDAGHGRGATEQDAGARPTLRTAHVLRERDFLSTFCSTHGCEPSSGAKVGTVVAADQEEVFRGCRNLREFSLVKKIVNVRIVQGP